MLEARRSTEIRPRALLSMGKIRTRRLVAHEWEAACRVMKMPTKSPGTYRIRTRHAINRIKTLTEDEMLGRRLGKTFGEDDAFT